MHLIDLTYSSIPFYELALTEISDPRDRNILRGCWGLDDSDGISCEALMENYGVSEEYINKLTKVFNPIFHKWADWWRDQGSILLGSNLSN